MRKKKLVLYCLVLLLPMLPSWIQLAAADSAKSPVKILITPLWLHSAEDLGFLNRGILEMLATRLPSGNGIEVLQATKAPQDDADAVAMAEKQKADYVLTGGATLFDQRVSTDLRLISAADSRVVLAFSRFGRQPGDILGHIDELAPEIIKKITGTAGPNAQEKKSPQAMTPQPAVPPGQPSAAPGRKVTPRAQDSVSPAQSIWKGAAADFEIISLVAANMAGGDDTFIAAAGSHTIVLLKMDISSKTFSQVATWEIPGHQTILRLDAADLDQNDKAELYVTILDKSQRLASSVLVYDQKKLIPAMQSLAWFFSAPQTPGEPARLFGQKQKKLGRDSDFEIEDPTPFLAGLYSLHPGKHALEPAKKLDVPDEVTIFDFTFGAVVEAKRQHIIAFDRRDRLQVFSPDGRNRIWRSSDPFGGSETYVTIPSDMGTDRAGRLYLPQRILLTHADPSGRQDMIVVRNQGVTKRFFKRFRGYNKGEIVRLTWTGAAFKEQRIGEPLSGYISDMTLTALVQARPQCIVAALVIGEGGILSKRNTQLVVHAIGTAK